MRVMLSFSPSGETNGDGAGMCRIRGGEFE